MSIIFQPQLTTRGQWRLSDISGVCSRCWTRLYSNRTVKENDIVLLRRKGKDHARPMLTKPLNPDRRFQTPQGHINGSSIIGRKIRDVVSTNKDVNFRIHEPTLAEYLLLCPRIVTPIYPAEANLIVSLLDLHPQDRDESQGRLEIFEAGTGHGGLTLHLSRAIHGANSPVPPLPPLSESETSVERSSHDAGQDSGADKDSVVDTPLDPIVEELDEKYKTYLNWLASRKAVVHTLDIQPRYSKFAQTVVRNFRHGLYYHNVDFHTGTIEDYITQRMKEDSEPFLDHAILDLPACHKYLPILGEVLKSNGSLMVFCPSITQINNCVQLVKDEKLPLVLEKVLELGNGGGVGGREWDVRAVKPRALLKAEEEAREKADGELPEEEGLDDSDQSENSVESDQDQDSGWTMVCRPKVGGKISGGGFLALWRKMEHSH